MKQTQFVQYWRSVNTLLTTAEQPATTQGPAHRAYAAGQTPAAAARGIIAAARTPAPNRRQNEAGRECER